MTSRSISKLSYLRTLWEQGVWTRWVAAVWTIVGVALVFRDEFLPATWQSSFRLPTLVAFLSWHIWAIILLLIVVTGLFEASFGAHRTEVAARLTAEENLKPGGLKLSFDAASVLTQDPPGRLRRVLLASVKNETGAPLDSCTIQAIITAVDGREHAYPLCEPFSLLVDELKEKPVLEYDLAGDRRLVLPIFWKKRHTEWTREPGGLIAEGDGEIVLQALSSAARAVRLRLMPRFEDDHWEFNIL